MLRQLTTSVRAMLFFGLLGLITLLLGLFSIRQLTHINGIVDELGNSSLPQVIIIGEISQILSTGRIDVLSYGVATNDNERQGIRDHFTTLAKDYDAAEQRILPLISHDDAKQLLSEISQLKRDYYRHVNNMFDLHTAGRISEANDLLQNTLRPLGNQITITLNNLSEVEARHANEQVDIAHEAYQSDVINIIIAIVLALIVVVSLAIIFSRSIVTPLQYAVSVAKRIAEGNLSEDIKDQGKDEAAALTQALQQMQTQLRNTIVHISDSAQQLASTSEELSVVTNESSAIVQQQADQLEQAATAINELTVAIDEVAQSASTTSNNSEQANNKAKIGQGKLDETIHTIGELTNEVSKTTQGMGELAGNIRGISQVVDVIRSIAEQTNLLALNAAIEAARAGESGRGFAVVADEVRALAHRTQESTKEIESMIHSIQQETQLALNNMESSNQWANNTLAMAKDTGEVLREITVFIASINEQNLSIASASEEQATVAREVDKGLVAIRDLSFQTSAGANQTSASSTELAKLAEQLNHLIKHFRL